MKKRVNESEKVPVLLSPRQVELIFEHTFADDSLLKPLSVAEVVGGKRRAMFTLHDLEDLEGYVAAAANHCDDTALQKKLDAVFEYLQKVQSQYDLQY